jgi:hypothetical protein
LHAEYPDGVDQQETRVKTPGRKETIYQFVFSAFPVTNFFLPGAFASLRENLNVFIEAGFLSRAGI